MRPVTGTSGGAYWQTAFGPRLAGDIRRGCPAALPPNAGGSLRDSVPVTRPVQSRSRYSARPVGADAIYIIGQTGICQPFFAEKMHKVFLFRPAD